MVGRTGGARDTILNYELCNVSPESGYKSEWRLYHNFFCPSVKLINKKRVASKTIKRYDKPKTPYQRVLESKNVSRSVKLKLKEQFKELNPFTLRKNMEKKLKKIFDTTK